MLDVTFYKVKHGGATEKETLVEARKIIPYIKQSDVFSLEMTAHSKEEVYQIARSWAAVLKDSQANRTNVRRMMENNLGGSRGTNDNGGLYLLTLTDYLFRSKVGLWLAERFSTREEGMMVNVGFNKTNIELTKAMIRVRKREPDSESDLYEIDKRRYAFVDVRDRLMAQSALDDEQILREIHPWLADKEKIVYGIPIGAFHEPERFLPSAKVVSLADGLPEHISLFGELRSHIKKETPLENVVELIRAVADTDPMR